ncbi:MAG: hypothetical protein ACRD3N_17570 [Terracidiphilus sp.]
MDAVFIARPVQSEYIEIFPARLCIPVPAMPERNVYLGEAATSFVRTAMAAEHVGEFGDGELRPASAQRWSLLRHARSAESRGGRSELTVWKAAVHGIFIGFLYACC